MTFSNLKTMKKDRGFTIVELLIVIVVIAILAAIIIVAYNGVTARANTAKAQTNAVAIQKKSEAYNADTAGGNGTYPATIAAWQTYTTSNPSALGAIPSGVTLSSSAPTSGNGTTTVQYLVCSNATPTVVGYQIKYWDYTTGAVSTNVITGGQSSGTGITCA